MTPARSAIWATLVATYPRVVNSSRAAASTARRVCRGLLGSLRGVVAPLRPGLDVIGHRVQPYLDSSEASSDRFRGASPWSTPSPRMSRSGRSSTSGSSTSSAPSRSTGSLLHCACALPSGLRYIDVWESEEPCAPAFDDRIHPAVDRAFGGARPPGEPEVHRLDVIDIRGEAVPQRVPMNVVAPGMRPPRARLGAAVPTAIVLTGLLAARYWARGSAKCRFAVRPSSGSPTTSPSRPPIHPCGSAAWHARADRDPGSAGYVLVEPARSATYPRCHRLPARRTRRHRRRALPDKRRDRDVAAGDPDPQTGSNSSNDGSPPTPFAPSPRSLDSCYSSPSGHDVGQVGWPKPGSGEAN